MRIEAECYSLGKELKQTHKLAWHRTYRNSELLNFTEPLIETISWFSSSFRCYFPLFLLSIECVCVCVCAFAIVAVNFSKSQVKWRGKVVISFNFCRLKRNDMKTGTPIALCSMSETNNDNEPGKNWYRLSVVWTENCLDFPRQSIKAKNIDFLCVCCVCIFRSRYFFSHSDVVGIFQKLSPQYYSIFVSIIMWFWCV